MRQGRRGAADGPANARMYDRFIVCHVRTVLDLKKDEVALSVPSSAMVTKTLWWRRMPVGLACVRPAGGDEGAAATTTDSKARSRPPPRQSGCSPWQCSRTPGRSYY